MITTAILSIFASVLYFIFDLLPNVPAFPTGLVDAMDYFMAVVIGAVGLISYLFTPALTVFTFTALLVILNFENIYKLASWFWHKVRG